MKKLTTLTIDSSEIHKTTVAICVGDEKKEKACSRGDHTSQQVLPLIASLLQENSLTFQDITAIVVHKGPGSFTGLRVGAVVAMMLGWLLNVPVNGKHVGKPPELDYGRDQWR